MVGTTEVSVFRWHIPASVSIKGIPGRYTGNASWVSVMCMVLLESATVDRKTPVLKESNSRVIPRYDVVPWWVAVSVSFETTVQKLPAPCTVNCIVIHEAAKNALNEIPGLKWTLYRKLSVNLGVMRPNEFQHNIGTISTNAESFHESTKPLSDIPKVYFARLLI